ncbi:hypothetical protein A2U01_0115375, partial [Trifolium medium]|nr:hypothetical protein [Trifolium medium]
MVFGGLQLWVAPRRGLACARR